MRSVAIDPVVGDPLSDLVEPGLMLGRGDPRQGDDRRRVRITRCPPDVDRKRAGIHCDELSDGPVEWFGIRRFLLALRLEQAAPAQVVLLVGEPVAPSLLAVLL